MAAHREMMPADRRQHFGSTLRLQEEAGDQWGWTWLDHLRQDILYGTRSLRRSPGFALTAIAVLSLGIGVNLAEIHLFQALRHRLHVRDVDSLCRFLRVTREGTTGAFSVPAIEFFRRYNTVLSAIVSDIDVPGIFHADDSDDLRASMVSGNFFSELGVRPAYGRMLDDQDDKPGAAPVAVLGYDYWQSRFGGDPGIVLKTIRLNGKPVQVVGIAPSEFGGLVRQPALVWIPMSQYPYLMGNSRWVVDRTNMFGRLKPGVSLEAAESQFRSLTAALRNQQPQSVEPNEWLKAEPADTTALKPGVLLLMTTCILLVLLVLLSACANLGNMLLARGLARRREMEIRLAIGAGRGRLIRQLMTENLLLAALASIAALLVGKMAAHILLRIIEAPSSLRIVIDWRIVLACAALGLAATLAFGLAPAFQAVRRGPAATRARKILVSLQVAVSCVLLILSSFFMRAAPRWTLYVAKLLVVMAMTAASTWVLLCGILIDGAILSRIQSDVVFGIPAPWAAIFRDGAQVLGLAFLALTVQHWVSLRWRSFSVAVGAVIVAMVAGCFALAAGQQAAGWAQYFPWALPMLVLARRPHHIAAALWISSALGLVVAAAGCWDFCRREVT